MAKELVDKLRDSGLVSAAVFEEIERETKASRGSFIVALSSRPNVPAEEIGLMVARHYALPFSHLQPGKVAAEAVPLLTLPVLSAARALPVEQKGKVLTLATTDPSLLGQIEETLRSRGVRLELVVAPAREIETELRRLDGSGSISATRDEEWHFGDGTARLAKAIEDGDAEAVINGIFGIGVEMAASDIHLALEDGCLVVRFRKDGVLHPIRPPCTEATASKIFSRMKILAGLDISERRLPQDGRARIELATRTPPISVLARVSTILSRVGEKLAVRILESGGGVIPLRQAGLSKSNFALLTEALRHPNGLILVTGPTGSGKTTTLYAALKSLSHEGISVFTIEDPIEYDLKGTYQSQVNEGIGLTFPTMLRSLLRQDPNVILLGEMRDKDTAMTAFEAALTGRLVLSTLHANSACTAIVRLLELGVEPFVLATCTRAIVGQRLVRMLCICKRPVYRMPEQLVRIKRRLGVTGSSLFEPTGCARCSNTGFAGRVAIHEVLTLDRELADLILGGASSSELLAAAQTKGFRPLAHDGYQKVLGGMTTVAEIERQAGPAGA